MRGLQVHVEVQVGQPVETVWRYVAEGYFEHHSRWDPAVVEMVKLTSGPVAAGTRGREVRRFAGRQAAGFTVTDAAEPSRFALSNTSGPFALDRIYEFKPTGAGCTVSFSFDMCPKAAMRLAFPLLRNTIAAQVKANIGRLPSALAEVGENLQ
jgi:hypothetical protein